jgi:hypothetical protein
MQNRSGVKLGGVFDIRCIGPDGREKWRDKAENIVVDEGLNYILGILFNGDTPSDPWYIGLTDGAPSFAAGDTLSGAHSGWSEVTAYSEGSRQEFMDNAVSSQSVDNSGSLASFSVNADGTTIGGAFLADDNTAGGTSGKLLSGAAFSGGDKQADSGDTLEVQYTFSAADDGS